MTCDGASCLGCGKPQLGDWAVDVLVREECDLTRPTPSRAEVARVVDRLENAERDGRVARFSPVRQSRPDLMPEFALHEAGHAVVGVMLGKRVKIVDVDSAVSCHFHGTPNIAPLDHVLMLLAGHAVAQRFQRVRRRFPSDMGFCVSQARVVSAELTCDVCLAFKQIGKAMPDASDEQRIEAFYEREDRAIGLMRRTAVWRAVEAVAAALVEHGHLSGDEVERIAAEAGVTPGREREKIPGSFRGGPPPRGTRDCVLFLGAETSKPEFPLPQ